MGDKIEKFAKLNTPEEQEAYVALARIVRTTSGAKRFRTPIGSPIQDRPKELQKLDKGTRISPETGRVTKSGKSPAENHKLFAMRVEELKKALEKLDANAIENLLKQLEAAKDLPKSANYQKIRDMLKKYLKERKGTKQRVKDKLKGN